MNLRRIFVKHTPGLEILKYIGPGFFVTVGFIDPGNWASNIAAGSNYGYSLLWMVTLSTLMLIFLQHNSGHMGIVTGLPENLYFSKSVMGKHANPLSSKIVLWSIAVIVTVLNVVLLVQTVTDF